MPADTTPKNSKSNGKPAEEQVADVVEAVADEASKIDNMPEANPEIEKALEGLLSMAKDGHIHGLAVAFALGPEHSGKAMIHGNLHATLSATCLVMANQLAVEPFVISEQLEAEKAKEIARRKARPTPELVV